MYCKIYSCYYIVNMLMRLTFKNREKRIVRYANSVEEAFNITETLIGTPANNSYISLEIAKINPSSYHEEEFTPTEYSEITVVWNKMAAISKRKDEMKKDFE